MQDAIAFQRNRNYTGCELEFNKTHLCTVFTQMAVMELQAAALMILVDSLATSVNTLCLSVEHRSADCMSRSTPPIIEATESSVSPADSTDLKFISISGAMYPGKCNPPLGRIAA